MSRRQDSSYDEAEKRDDRYDADNPSFGYPYIPGWVPYYGTTEDENAGGTEYGERREEDGSWWDEGLISTLLVVGVVLFIIPEPATSGLGIFLITVGVMAWLIDWAT